MYKTSVRLWKTILENLACCWIIQGSTSLTLLAAVDELSSVDALSSDEQLCPLLEAVRVTEGHFGQGSTTAGVMDDILRRPPELNKACTLNNNQSDSSSLRQQVTRLLAHLHNPLDVAMAFSEVNVAEFSGTLSVLHMGFEHGARTFSLSPDHTSHRVLKPDNTKLC